MKQTTESFLRIQAIFHEVVEAPEQQRSALIEARCGPDRELAAEVRSLLEACAAEENFSGSGSVEPETGGEANLESSQTESAPIESTNIESRQIGPYLIDRLLGRGGMGAVYLAHRADGQFEQKVAIKLIDLPLATSVFRERFRQERQILAGLRHPYIATLLDGGVTAGGELYLVMEFVDGMPIDDFCESRHLAIPERLQLFLRVCEAVQFAHQNFVVHRDLKPDNILAVEDSTPRLLDFGTAKLLSPAPDKPDSELTRAGYHSFTPQYASPEQVLGHPITTASDTYSLGVLLYVLLTGKAPYELKELTTAEMLRVICEEPPQKPAHAAGSLKRVDPDLEAILLKALRKEPAERYLTVEQFSSDVNAFLNNRPVAARRGNLRYRAGKFMRRHRVGIAAAALLAASLVAGGAGILWQAKVANEERRKADARSADLRQLSNSLLSELDEAIKQLPGSTGAQKLLVTRVLEHLDRMAKDSQGDRTAQLDLIDAYTRLGNVLGNGYEQNLGDRPGALASIDKAVALAQALADSDPKDPDALRALAKAQGARGDILSETSDIEGAVASLRAEVATYDRLISLPHASAAMYFEASVANGALGDVVGQDTGLADVPAALIAYRKCLELDSRAIAVDPGFMPARRGMATMQMKVGNAELDTDPAQALKDFQLALERFDSLPASEQKVVSTVRLRGITLRKVAAADSELGDYAHAAPLFEQAIAIHQRLVDADPKDIRNLGDLARALGDQSLSYQYAENPELNPASGDLRQNLLGEERSLVRSQATIGSMLKITPRDPDRQAELGSTQARLGAVRWLLHETGDSEKLSRMGLATLRSGAARDQASTHVLSLAVVAYLQAEPVSLRDPQFALALAERGAMLTKRKDPESMLYLAQAYRAAGDAANSRAAAKEGLALLPAWQPGSVKPNIRKLLEAQAR